LIKHCFGVCPSSHGPGHIVRDILLYDSAALGVIWRIMMLSTEALDVSDVLFHIAIPFFFNWYFLIILAFFNKNIASAVIFGTE
jgi:hypothetical protein